MRVDATLSPGELTETVTVTGEAAGRLQTEDSSLGLVIDTRNVQGLPLPSRNVLSLLNLAGGVSRRGTNALRGGAYEYFRHESMNARNFFDKINNRPKPQDRYSQFGAKLGGPVRLPGYDGRGRTFFFANYEALRRRAPGSPVSTIPDAAFRAGDFSASPVSIIDPLTGLPFAGNRIPADRIDPARGRSWISG